MKRHLLILAPLFIFALFVGCNHDDAGNALPPPLANLPPAKATSCQISKAVNQCKSSMGPEVLLLMTQKNNGGNQDNTALLLAMLNKPQPRTIDPIPGPDCAAGEAARHQGETRNSLSCNDALVLAMMFAKSAEDTRNNGKLWWDASFRRYVEARFKNAVIDYGMGLPISPAQRLVLGQNFQAALNQSGAFNGVGYGPNTAGLNPNNVAYVSAALNAYNSQQYNGGATLNSSQNTMTLNNQNSLASNLNQNSSYNLGTNPYGQSSSSGIQSTSLHLGATKRGLASEGGTTAQQTLDTNQLRAARGFGLSAKKPQP